MIDHFVAKYGLDTDGGGHADVFMPKGKSYVWRAWTKDPGYESFLRYVEAHKGNPHLPKVLSRVREEPIKVKGTPKGVTLKFVKLERLKPLKDEMLKDVLDEIRNDISAHDRVVTFNKRQAHWRELLKKYPLLFKTMAELYQYGADDIDSTNVMMRDDVPVIIDPAHKALAL